MLAVAFQLSSYTSPEALLSDPELFAFPSVSVLGSFSALTKKSTGVSTGFLGETLITDTARRSYRQLGLSWGEAPDSSLADGGRGPSTSSTSDSRSDAVDLAYPSASTLSKLRWAGSVQLDSQHRRRRMPENPPLMEALKDPLSTTALEYPSLVNLSLFCHHPPWTTRRPARHHQKMRRNERLRELLTRRFADMATDGGPPLDDPHIERLLDAYRRASTQIRAELNVWSNDYWPHYVSVPNGVRSARKELPLPKVDEGGISEQIPRDEPLAPLRFPSVDMRSLHPPIAREHIPPAPPTKHAAMRGSARLSAALAPLGPLPPPADALTPAGLPVVEKATPERDIEPAELLGTQTAVLEAEAAQLIARAYVPSDDSVVAEPPGVRGMRKKGTALRSLPSAALAPALEPALVPASRPSLHLGDLPSAPSAKPPSVDVPCNGRASKRPVGSEASSSANRMDTRALGKVQRPPSLASTTKMAAHGGHALARKGPPWFGLAPAPPPDGPLAPTRHPLDDSGLKDSLHSKGSQKLKTRPAGSRLTPIKPPGAAARSAVTLASWATIALPPADVPSAATLSAAVVGPVTQNEAGSTAVVNAERPAARLPSDGERPPLQYKRSQLGVSSPAANSLPFLATVAASPIPAPSRVTISDPVALSREEVSKPSFAGSETSLEREKSSHTDRHPRLVEPPLSRKVMSPASVPKGVRLTKRGPPEKVVIEPLRDEPKSPAKKVVRPTLESSSVEHKQEPTSSMKTEVTIPVAASPTVARPAAEKRPSPLSQQTSSSKSGRPTVVDGPPEPTPAHPWASRATPRPVLFFGSPRSPAPPGDKGHAASKVTRSGPRIPLATPKVAPPTSDIDRPSWRSQLPDQARPSPSTAPTSPFRGGGGGLLSDSLAAQLALEAEHWRH